MKQQISSPMHKKWVTKIFSYYYEVIYKKGKENVVVDGLSQEYEEDGSLFSLSFIVLDWLQVLRREWLQDLKILSCSTNCNTILQFLQGTLGIMKSFATKAVCIYASNPKLNP